MLIPELGPPRFETDEVNLYLGDCLDHMRRMPSESVSLTVTSPPYNIGKPYETPLPLDDYLDWCDEWLGEIHRVTRTDGALWLNLGYVEVPDAAKALPLPYLLWKRIPFYIIQEIVWNYGAGVAARTSFSPRNEKFLWCVKNPDRYTFNLDAVRDKDVKYPNQRKNGKLRCNPLGKNPTDVWHFPKVTSGANRSSPERTAHPAQFPAAVIERIVRTSSNPGELVMDPFLGSGTTAEACLRTGRRALGFEIREDYVRIAEQRIDAHLRRKALQGDQRPLFSGVQID